MQIGLGPQQLGTSIRNQLLLFIKILSLLCSVCEGVACFLLCGFERTLLYLLEVLGNETENFASTKRAVKLDSMSRTTIHMQTVVSVRTCETMMYSSSTDEHGFTKIYLSTPTTL